MNHYASRDRILGPRASVSTKPIRWLNTAFHRNPAISINQIIIITIIITIICGILAATTGVCKQQQQMG